MSTHFKFVCIILTLSLFYVTIESSKIYSVGGLFGAIKSNGFSIHLEVDKLFCGNLTCTGAVNCEIIKRGSKIDEKCMDSNLRVIEQKSYSGSSFGEDVELYFGPAYKQQVEEQRLAASDIISVASGANHNKKTVTYVSIFAAFLLSSLACRR